MTVADFINKLETVCREHNVKTNNIEVCAIEDNYWIHWNVGVEYQKADTTIRPYIRLNI